MKIEKINMIEDLDGFKFENYVFKVVDGKLVIKNVNENFEISFEINNKRRTKIANSIEKLLNLKLEFESLDSRELISFIESKGFGKTIFSPAGKAMGDYGMIKEGDRIAVGVSGGKDSLTLLNILVRTRKISNINFEIIPIHIHPTQESHSANEIRKYCEFLGLKLIVEETNLEQILEGIDKNPCFMCGRIRRGILYTMMKEMNINKLALGHHKDDIVETFLLNIFYQGNMSVMKPKYMSKEHGVEVIRPMAYIEEKNIIRYARKNRLPILACLCKYETSEDSKRLETKEMIEELSKKNKNIRSIIFNSITPLLEKEAKKN